MMKRGNTKLSASFKSPMRQEGTPTSRKSVHTPEEIRAEIDTLKVTAKELDDQIEVLIKGGFKESELSSHIDKLHEYNEIKDVGQMLIGKIAMQEGCTTKHMYEELGMDMED